MTYAANVQRSPHHLLIFNGERETVFLPGFVIKGVVSGLRHRNVAIKQVFDRRRAFGQRSGPPAPQPSS